MFYPIFQNNFISVSLSVPPPYACKVAYIPDIGGVESRVNPEQVATNAVHGQKGAGGRTAGAGGGKRSSGWGSRVTLRKMTWGWVEGFLNVSKAFRRIDATEGTYLKDIQVLAA